MRLAARRACGLQPRRRYVWGGGVWGGDEAVHDVHEVVNLPCMRLAARRRAVHAACSQVQLARPLQFCMLLRHIRCGRTPGIALAGGGRSSLWGRSPAIALAARCRIGGNRYTARARATAASNSSGNSSEQQQQATAASNSSEQQKRHQLHEQPYRAQTPAASPSGLQPARQVGHLAPASQRDGDAEQLAEPRWWTGLAGRWIWQR